MRRFKNILCVASAELKDNAALEHAAKLAENNQAHLTVVEVIEEIPLELKLVDRVLTHDDLQAKIVMQHQARLEELVSTWSRKIEIKTKVLTGISFLEVIYEVLRHEHDLVFKMAESDELLNRVYGSDDMHLLRKCPCPVWLVKGKSPETCQRILAAVDVDDNYPSEELNTRHLLNHQILEMASSLALSESAELHIVHAWEGRGVGLMRGGFMTGSEEEVVAYDDEVKQRRSQNVDTLVSEIIDKSGRDAPELLKPETHLLKGSPSNEVPAFANMIEADLVVMGTVARTGIAGFFMGNTAETILNRLKCSVLAIKPPSFETPVTLED